MLEKHFLSFSVGFRVSCIVSFVNSIALSPRMLTLGHVKNGEETFKFTDSRQVLLSNLYFEHVNFYTPVCSTLG